ncbi:MAG: hypothetical protein ACKO6Q_09800 [Bacteroidota bacterium]
MRKNWLLLFGMFLSLIGGAQKSEIDMNAPGVITDATLQKRAFKASQPTEDKIETFDVAALGQTTYTAANVMDGSVTSFQHTLRIVVGLLTPAYKNGTVQLVFYGTEERIQQAAANENGSISIYYPLAVYESLRSRLEQSITARKKVTIKMTQKTNGYREGVLVF